ncbi:outer membrane protein assembly factor BamB family protein [Brachybacterium sp. AOP43-C2-M15]|uniref:outer membrane protein assembly factor BamB family protein n=1 Tax=Brachybacterium sp. AOP43-C2-M15 TaxID=3457661 RepID=UPI004033508A
MTGRSDVTDHPDATPAEPSPQGPRRRPWGPWALGAGGVLMVVVLVLGAARPEFAMRWWDGSGLDCGRGLSPGDPQDLASLWAAWGEGEHEPQDDLDIEDHRAHVEELARQLDAEPVGEIPRRWTTSTEDGRSVEAKVEAVAQGEQIRVSVRGGSGEEAVRRIAAIDPATGDPAWHWDLDEGHDAWVEQHGEHLVLANRIVRGHNVFEGDLWTDMLSLDAATGERQGCHRFAGFPGYGAGSTDAGLVVGTESWNPMVADEEQEVGTRTIQQVTLPRFSQGFDRTLPSLEYESFEGMTRSRPQPLVTLPGGFFLTYASALADGGNDAFGSAQNGTDFPADTTPVEAFSMDTGESLWSYGEPGDRIAFVSGVPGIPGEASGVLLAEIGEFEPSESDPERGSSSATLRMLDGQGEQLWEAPAADIGEALGGSDGERYLRVQGDVILVHTAPHVVTALDAATGEELWSIDESDAGEPQRLWLMEAVDADGKLFLPGSGREYMVDARTGEHDDELAGAMVDARVSDISAVGEDMLLVQTRDYGPVLLQQ